MPLKKILFKPGVDKENTRYTTEGGWYDCDKIRFRAGTPEKIGGWQRTSNNTFLGTCRTIFPWITLASISYNAVGTNLKFYVESGGGYYDITPLRTTTAAGAITFAATNGSALITVTNVAHGAQTGDFVTFSGAVTLGGVITASVLNKEYQITEVINANTYTITAAVAANASDTGNGGAAVVGAYQISVGAENQVALVGWGAGPWGSGTWGLSGGAPSYDNLRIWNADNFGEDLVFGPSGGGLYYWYGAGALETRGVLVSSLSGASDVPQYQRRMLVSDVSRFVIVFGTNEPGLGVYDPLLIRWSDQESVTNWTPSATNQAGSIRLSKGSEIIAVQQSRQEILVWSDVALYSMQYVGAPVVWSVQLLGDNLTIISPNSTAIASGVVYWMGEDKFYVYDGSVRTLPCTLRQYVFSDFNKGQSQQVFAGTVEQFSEVWWFYCSANSETIDKYVVYNYLDNAWYYGTMARTAWTDANINSDYPLAASLQHVLVAHEYGTNNVEGESALPINAYISSSEFDIEDGHNFGFVWRMLPDITFRNSATGNGTPQVTMSLIPLQNSGSGYNSPESVAGSNAYPVARIGTYTVEQFTGQINTRVRGRQMVFKVESDALGTQWQLGAPRIDIRPDGRKS